VCAVFKLTYVHIQEACFSLSYAWYYYISVSERQFYFSFIQHSRTQTNVHKQSVFITITFHCRHFFCLGRGFTWEFGYTYRQWIF